MSEFFLAVSFFALSAAPSLAQQHALELAAGSRVEFPHHGVMNTGDTATIEFWARSTSTNPSGVLGWERYAGSAEHKTLYVIPDGAIRYLYAGSPWGPPGDPFVPNAPAGSCPVDMEWHHLAFVRRATGRWELYADGTSVLSMGPGTGLFQGCWATCGIINAATTTTINSSGGWQIDSLRVSSVERYCAQFTPQRQFQSDSVTAMLLDFDEGTGTTINDNGVASQVGQIVGSAQWISLCTDPASCCASGPSTYCTAKINSMNCDPAIGHTGTPSFTGADDFHVTASNVLNNKYGLLMWSTLPHNVPFIGGTLCVKQPIRRTEVQDSRGTINGDDCSGTFDFHFSRSYMLQQQLTSSDLIYAQYWYRDPGFPIGLHYGLTNGLAFSICP